MLLAIQIGLQCVSVKSRLWNYLCVTPGPNENENDKRVAKKRDAIKKGLGRPRRRKGLARLALKNANTADRLFVCQPWPIGTIVNNIFLSRIRDLNKSGTAEILKFHS